MASIFDGFAPNAAAPTFDSLADVREILARLPYRIVNVQGYGATGDGLTDDRAALVAAEAALGGLAGTLALPKGTYRIATSLSFAATTHLDFDAGAVLAPDVGATLTINGPVVAPERQIFGGSGAVVATNQGVFWSRWFGAKGDNTGDDGPAINRAILAAQASRNATVVIGAGVFRYTTQILVAGLSTGLSIVGLEPAVTFQQGSTGAPCVLNWAGNNQDAVSVTASFTQIANLAIYNTGTGLSAFNFHPNGHAEISHVSFAGPNGSTPWSVAAIKSAGGLNYSAIRFCNFDVSPAIQMTGVHTTLEVCNSVFDATGANPAIDLNGVAGDLVSIHNCTFNSQATANTFVDCASSTGALGNLVFRDCEFDCAAGAFQSYVAKLKNVYNFTLQNCEISNFSNAANVASLVQLTAVPHTRVDGCNLSHLNKPLIKCNDTTCRVSLGVNRVDVATTAGMVDTTGAAPPNTVALDSSTGPVAATVRLHGELVDPTQVAVFEVTVPNNTAFAVQIPGATDGVDPGWMAPGQVFWVRIRNASGGVMGAVTFDATKFKTAGAFTVPAAGFSRSVGFYFNGTTAWELARGAADVTN